MLVPSQRKQRGGCRQPCHQKPPDHPSLLLLITRFTPLWCSLMNLIAMVGQDSYTTNTNFRIFLIPKDFPLTVNLRSKEASYKRKSNSEEKVLKTSAVRQNVATSGKDVSCWDLSYNFHGWVCFSISNCDPIFWLPRGFQSPKEVTWWVMP